MRRILFVLGLLASLQAAAVITGHRITPERVSVAGNEAREFRARFVHDTGEPAAGVSVTFINDACGHLNDGGFQATVRTNANGEAAILFRARNQGITCRLAAAAPPGIGGVTWDVNTFTLPQVHFETSFLPPEPRPGEPYTLVVTPMAGAYRLYETEVAAQVIEGTASASLHAAAANSGQEGAAHVQVTPDHRMGGYAIEVAFRDKTHRVAIEPPDAPWQDLWWGGPTENGWGVSIVQHRDVLFVVVYAYDAAGLPTWYVMPGGTWSEDRSEFSGAVYQPRGTPFHGYDAAALAVGEPVGAMRLRFVAGHRAVLDFVSGATTVRKTLERQAFAAVASPTLPARFDDMWWGGLDQNGWGIAVLQRYRTLFAVWFTYDDAGIPRWFVMPSGNWSNASTYQGRIYRSSGAPWLGGPYDAGAFRLRDVGHFRFRFGEEGATFEYNIEGRMGSLALERQPF